MHLVDLCISPSGANGRRFARLAAVLRLRAGQLPELPGRVVPAVLVPAVRAVPGALVAGLPAPSGCDTPWVNGAHRPRMLVGVL